MEALKLAQEVNALPEQTRAAIERLVLLLKKSAGALARRQLLVLYPADPTQAGQSFADPEFFGAWTDQTDIVDGTEYVHQVRRGLRPA